MLDYERVTAPLSLTRTGSGEPLLLLHGLGTSAATSPLSSPR